MDSFRFQCPEKDPFPGYTYFSPSIKFDPSRIDYIFMSYFLMTKSLAVDTISKNRMESDHFGIMVDCAKEAPTEPPYRFNNYILKNHKYRGELYEHIKSFFLR